MENGPLMDDLSDLPLKGTMFQSANSWITHFDFSDAHIGVSKAMGGTPTWMI